MINPLFQHSSNVTTLHAIAATTARGGRIQHFFALSALMPLDEHEIATLSKVELHAKLIGFRVARALVVALVEAVEMDARAAASGAIETNSDASWYAARIHEAETPLQGIDADIESLERAIHERASPAETRPNIEEQAVETAEGGAVEPLSKTQVKALRLKELRVACAKRGLSEDGLCPALRERLNAHEASPAGQAAGAAWDAVGRAALLLPAAAAAAAAAAGGAAAAAGTAAGATAGAAGTGTRAEEAAEVEAVTDEIEEAEEEAEVTFVREVTLEERNAIGFANAYDVDKDEGEGEGEGEGEEKAGARADA